MPNTDRVNPIRNCVFHPRTSYAHNLGSKPLGLFAYLSSAFLMFLDDLYHPLFTIL